MKMKNIMCGLLALIGLTTISCTDEITDREAISIASTPVLLTPTNTFSQVLTKTNATNICTTFVWEDAIYNGTTTVVTYAIELAKAGTNFANPQTITTTTDRFKDVTVEELNSAILAAGLFPNIEHSLDIRIKSFVGTVGTGVSSYSNFFTITATPYPSWPSWGIIGSATITGWSTDTDMNYDLTTGLYSITMTLSAGEIKFRLEDSWTTNFGDDGNNLTLDAGGANIPIPTAGTYTIICNFDSVAHGGIPAKTYTIQ